MNFDAYDPQSFYDEYFAAAGKLRPELAPILQWFQALPSQDMAEVKAKLEAVLEELGATFSFEGEEQVLPAVPNSKIQTFWDSASHLSEMSQWRVKKYCYEWVCSVSTGSA